MALPRFERRSEDRFNLRARSFAVQNSGAFRYRDSTDLAGLDPVFKETLTSGPDHSAFSL